MEVAAAVLSGFVLAVLAPGVERRCGRASGWLLATLPAGLAGYFASQLASLPERGGLVRSCPWMPALGIELSFLLDGLGLLMALLITGIGALILIYAGGYLADHPQLGRLHAFLLFFMAAMLGLVLADNLIALFVFWELTSLSSYLLIGFEHEREEARAAALQALLVTGAGGLALLAGFVLLGQLGGSYELSVLLSQSDALAAGPQRTAVVLLVLAGAFTKSAQFPFHFWLPSAMQAPTPVSAYLHSATMVKAGVYLLARLHPLLGATAEWQLLVAPVGLITMLLGALLAMQVDDLKRILAYSTVSALGLLTLLLGMGSETALAAAVVFLLAHALYKGALFLVAGAVDHETGTRQADQLSGLGRSMPIVAAAAVAAGLSMAGLPPLFGFIAKERVYEAALGSGEWWAGWTASTVAAGMLFVAVAGVVAVRPFFGPPGETPRQPHEPPPSLWLGPLVLAGLGLLLGLLPAAAEGLLGLALAAIRQQPTTPLHLGLWHGPGAAPALSVLTLLGGLACYAGRGRFRSLESVRDWGPARGYELGIDGLNRLASLQTRLLQSGYLRYYLMIILLAVSGVVALSLADEIRDIDFAGISDLRFYEVGLIGLTMLAALFAVRPQPRLAAIATLGVVGYSIALLFVLYGAPDLAMTQFLVETLTVILFVLVFYHLPPSPELSPAAGRLRDSLLAVLVGGVMTVLVLLAVQTGPLATISGFFVEQSLPAGHGRNVVNVILVDFRGLDTLGEITVLAVAAVGVYALLKLRPADAATGKKPLPQAAIEPAAPPAGEEGG